MFDDVWWSFVRSSSQMFPVTVMCRCRGQSLCSAAWRAAAALWGKDWSRCWWSVVPNGLCPLTFCPSHQQHGRRWSWTKEIEYSYNCHSLPSTSVQQKCMLSKNCQRKFSSKTSGSRTIVMASILTIMSTTSSCHHVKHIIRSGTREFRLETIPFVFSGEVASVVAEVGLCFHGCRPRSAKAVDKMCARLCRELGFT